MLGEKLGEGVHSLRWAILYTLWVSAVLFEGEVSEQFWSQGKGIHFDHFDLSNV